MTLASPQISRDKSCSRQQRSSGSKHPRIAVPRLTWNCLSTGSGYEETKAALARAKGRRWYAAVRGQQDALIGSFAHPQTERSSNWYKTEMIYDPVATLRKLKVPGLCLFGADDQLIPAAKSAENIRQTLTESGRRDFTIRMFPGADHGIYIRDATGSMRLASGYEETMKQWVLLRLR